MSLVERFYEIFNIFRASVSVSRNFFLVCLFVHFPEAYEKFC